MGVTVTLGNRKVTCEDIATIAWEPGSLVQLDPSCLEKCDEGRKRDSIAEEVVLEATDYKQVEKDRGNGKQQHYLSLEESRAAVACRIASLLIGRSGVCSLAVERLASLLNAGLVQQLPSDPLKEGKAVVDLIVLEKQTSSDNRNDRDINLGAVVKLTQKEYQTLSLRGYGHVGRAALLAHMGYALSDVADVAAALSCELVRAPLDPFSSLHFDICRPQRGQMISADNMRILISGSKRCLSKTAVLRNTSTTFNVGSDNNNSPSCFDVLRLVPQLHGPVRDVCASVKLSVDVELNSAEAGPLCEGKDGGFYPFNDSQALCAISQASLILNTLDSCCQDRISAVRGILLGKTEDLLEAECEKLNSIAVTPCDDEATGSLHYAEVVKNKLLCEVRMVLLALKREDEHLQAKEAANEKERQASAAIHNTKEHSSAVLNDAGLTEAQRARIEAKRKQKADKNALKMAKKKEGKGLGSLLGLGEGSTSMYRILVPILDQQSIDHHYMEGRLVGILFRGGISRELERLSSSGARRKPKIPKGTRDQTPAQMQIREAAFSAIRRVFKLHGAVEIDTPVFELKETLTGKYGEDQKLIYDLADQGGELLALRYDLTVPFARYLAMHGIRSIKRFHMAKVYRRDNPNMAKGRYREFYQCDFDIAGSHGLMVPDAEVLSVVCEILDSLPIGNFEVKLNHRKLLDAILDICGCPPDLFRPICSAIDKLDKLPWDAVRHEMVVEKGLSDACADKLGRYATYSGPAWELWHKLNNENTLSKHKKAAEAMQELKLLFEYMEAMDTLKYISFDLSLARGLAYYTGLIYEAVVTDPDTKVGSIAAGGRYDGLVGMFALSTEQTPCVGVSIGVERVFAIMEERSRARAAQSLSLRTRTIFIASIGPGLLKARMAVAKLLWKANISAEFSSASNPKFTPQLQEVLDRGIPFMVIIGENEHEKGVVKIKDINAKVEEEVSMSQLVERLLSKGCPRVADDRGMDEFQ